MGRRYIIEHVISALNQQMKKERFDNYVAEGLRAIVYNTARQDNVITLMSYSELCAPKPSEDDDVKAEAIVDRIKKKLKGG